MEPPAVLGSSFQSLWSPGAAGAVQQQRWCPRCGWCSGALTQPLWGRRSLELPKFPDPMVTSWRTPELLKVGKGFKVVESHL